MEILEILSGLHSHCERGFVVLDPSLSVGTVQGRLRIGEGDEVIILVVLVVAGGDVAIAIVIGIRIGSPCDRIILPQAFFDRRHGRWCTRRAVF